MKNTTLNDITSALSLLGYDDIEQLLDESKPFTIEDAMQAAADWQLEQVITYIIAEEWFCESEWRITQLREAMRPTQEDNSWQ